MNEETRVVSEETKQPEKEVEAVKELPKDFLVSGTDFLKEAYE